MSNGIESTALHKALRNGHELVAKYLWGLDPNVAASVTNAGKSILYLAAESRCIEMWPSSFRSSLAFSSSEKRLATASSSSSSSYSSLSSLIFAMDLSTGSKELTEIVELLSLRTIYEYDSAELRNKFVFFESSEDG
ncbi:hypothetical protein LWI29_030236 [Acer saccharum]|uniref:Uncharacterized protein n=1 Tax=Acer saccharum TaxID=4024 RepID=A0AA39T7B8_ACESA|nr:hypothetical protein LWI29_030236 [Acer saccharum]